jgi:FixJ family two-component response regulator
MLEGRVSDRIVISIIDDDASSREGVTDLCGTLGFNTYSFPSAEDFLRSDQLSHTSCVITDMRMPGMTGLELHERLVEFGLAIPTVLITAYPDERVRERALRAGIVCYLVKPFAEDEFVECIRLALSHGRPAGND